MIYLDTSVALAQLLGEDRRPEPELWEQSLVTSRLLEYQLMVRLHGRRLGKSHGDAAQQLVARLAMLELSPLVLARALEPFPVELRTLEALHLTSLEFLRGQGIEVALASYDTYMLAAARALGIPVAPCG